MSLKVINKNSHQITLYNIKNSDVEYLINHEKGQWILEFADLKSPIYLNEILLGHSTALKKYDIIRIGKDKLHWADYYFEGDDQDLNKKDFLTFHGRLSMVNFRILTVLLIGLSICLYFIPTLIILRLYHRRGQMQTELETAQIGEALQTFAPIFFIICYGILGVLYITLAIKRIRDTGNPVWKLLVPVENIRLLFFSQSKRW